MYQVDFVAALFGGFLLVWLSGTNDSDAVPKPNGSILMFQISAYQIFRNANRDTVESSVLPVDAISTTCIGNEWLADIYRATPPPAACHGVPRLYAFNPENIEKAVRQELGQLSGQNVTVTTGISITLSPDSTVKESDVSWIGRAIDGAPDELTSIDSTISFTTRQVAIGAVHRSWGGKPRVTIKEPHYSVQGAADQLPGSRGTDSLYMPILANKFTHSNAYSELVAVKVRIVWDIGRTSECWEGNQAVHDTGDLVISLDQPC